MATWTSKTDYTDKVLAADFNALQTLKADIQKKTAANLGVLGEGEFGLETDTRRVLIGSSMGNQVIKGDYITPEMYGENTIPGTTDMTAAIQAAIAAAGSVPVYFGGGTYMTTACIYVTAAYSHLIFAKKAVILGNHTGPAILCIKQASGCILENPRVLGSAVNTPKCGIALGRITYPLGCQEIQIYNADIEGYFSKAAIYSIAAEVTTWYSPRVNILGGGAKYCFFTSDVDELSIDSFATGSNTVVNVYTPSFVNEQTGISGAAGVYIGMNSTGLSFGQQFHGGWIGVKSGVYVQINCEYDTVPRYLGAMITFLNTRGEGLSSGNAVLLSRAATNDVTLVGISFIKSYFTGVATFLYAQDYIITKDCIFETLTTYGLSLYKTTRCHYLTYADAGITIRNADIPPNYNYLIGNTPIKLTDGSATPTITAGSVYYSQNTNPTTITNFLGGIAGQVIHIVFYNTNTTILTNADIKLERPFYSQNTHALTLMHDGTRWLELSRQQQSISTTGYFLDYNVAANEANYLKAAEFGGPEDTFNIDSGFADSGYRIGVDADAIINDVEFQGTLAALYGARVRAGIFTAGPSGARTVTNVYGLYVYGYDNEGTITNKYGVYQVNANFKNHFDGDINTAGVIKVANTRVVGAQGATVADATDAASVITQLNLLLARCRAHGLIAT